MEVPVVKAIADAAATVESTCGPMVWLMATAGPRIGEVCRINVGDVDRARGRIRIHQTKSGTPRDVPVAVFVVDQLPLDDRPRATRTGAQV
ncbi:MAG: site-specific integrase [Actinomycetia bacterium]|nr:site-specific integrase [Actinomycetes bacterium]